MLKDFVEPLEARALVWGDTYKPEAADAAAAQTRQTVQAEFTRDGVQLVSDAKLDEHEAKWRQEWDRKAFAEGATIETDLMLAEAKVADAIQDAERLRPPQEVHGTTTEKYLLASVLDELQSASARQRLAGMTRLELVDVLAASKDDLDNALVRQIEQAALTNTLRQIGIRDDPDTDAVAVMRLTDAVKARRQARVPAQLLEARARLQKLKTTSFDFTMRHLRSGRGLAHRPAAMRIA
jgi:hypothetical protein